MESQFGFINPDREAASFSNAQWLDRNNLRRRVTGVEEAIIFEEVAGSLDERGLAALEQGQEEQARADEQTANTLRQLSTGMASYVEAHPDASYVTLFVDDALQKVIQDAERQWAAMAAVPNSYDRLLY